MAAVLEAAPNPNPPALALTSTSTAAMAPIGNDVSTYKFLVVYELIPTFSPPKPQFLTPMQPPDPREPPQALKRHITPSCRCQHLEIRCHLEGLVSMVITHTNDILTLSQQQKSLLHVVWGPLSKWLSHHHYGMFLIFSMSHLLKCLNSVIATLVYTSNEKRRNGPPIHLWKQV